MVFACYARAMCAGLPLARCDAVPGVKSDARASWVV